MRKRICKRIVSIILIAALTITLFPDYLLSAQASEALWVHMSNEEKNAGMASYDINTDTITFKTDVGWSSRMKYVGLSDVSGKDYAIEFDLNVNGGAIGVYNYEDSGVLYGAYLDLGAAAIDALQFTDVTTCVDDFWFREATTPGTTVHPQVTCETWPADITTSRLRVEFVRGREGSLANGNVTFYQVNTSTGTSIKLGSITIPANVKDNSALANCFGIQLWLGEGTVSNIVVEEMATWVHMSDAEKNAGMASYDMATDTISFKNDVGWSSRMKYVGLKDVSGKDYAIEFDLNVNGGAIGVYNFEDSGVLYGAYLDIGAAALDALHFTDITTCVDDFWFREATTPGATIHNQVPCSNWNAGDNAGSRLRVKFVRGEAGALAGGSVTFYKKDSSAGEFLKLGSVTIPSNVADDSNLANYFGIQLWLGEGTVSNISIEEIKPKQEDPVPEEALWVHMSDVEKDMGMASYDVATDTISFKNDVGWSSRMKYVGLKDVSGKDYALEFDLNVNGGAIGVYNFEDSGVLYGAYLDIGAAALDALQFTDVTTCVDDFWFREFTTEGATVHPQIPCSNWNVGDNTGSRLRVEFVRGEAGALAGGSVTFYKKNSSTGEFLKLGSVTIPSNVADDSNLANYFGIQLWLGEGTVSSISIEEMKPKQEDSVPEEALWIHMSDVEKDMGMASYDVATDTISFKNDVGWSSRMKYVGLRDASGKDYAIEFDLNVNGGAIGVYNFEDSGVLYGAYLDIGASALDALQFTDVTTCVDDFWFREFTTEGATVHPQIPCSNWNVGDNAGSRLRVEFARGEAGKLAGGTVTFYKKDNSTGEFLKLGKVTIPSNVADDANLANCFGIQLWLGEGTVSNISITEFEPKQDDIVSEETLWKHMSDVEKDMEMASYDAKTDTIHFKNDVGWSSRMKYVGLENVSGKDYAIEFDLNVNGGAIGVYNFEDSGVLYGAYLDIGASALDALQFTDVITCVDDFWFREFTTEGATVHPQIPCKNWNADDKAGSRLRVEFIRGNTGTLAGGTVKYYKKDLATGQYYVLGSVDIPSNVQDDPRLANYFGIQLWLGEGTVSNIKISELDAASEQGMISVYQNPKWIHLSDVEKEVGDAVYNEKTDTIVFSGAHGWSSRLENTEIEDLSGENFAVEMDLKLGSTGAIGISPFYEDATHFYNVYFNFTEYLLDGVGIMGADLEGNLNYIDDFSFGNDSLYPHFLVEMLSPTRGEDIQLRIECFQGKNGTMAGGTVYFYFRRQGFEEWKHMGVVKMPNTIVDHADVANKLMIHGLETSGTVSNISIIRDISSPTSSNQGKASKEWGYVSDYEKLVGGATFDDKAGEMILRYDAGWGTRMMCLTVPDVTGKAFAIEFDAYLSSSGGALGIVPFYEDADNWYGVYLDRAARRIEGAGFNDGEVIDDFDYVDATLYPSVTTLKFPTINQIRYRFEYFPNEDGAASGATCRIYYKQMPGGKMADDTWYLIGEFTMPETLVDNPDVANKIMISGRLICATLTDIDYEEIDPNTQTEYYNGPDDITFEDGYPEDVYQPITVQESKVPWWSIVMIVLGGGSFIGLLGWKIAVLIYKKRRKKEIIGSE